MKIALLGDILLHGRFCANENSNIYSYFKEISDFLANYDIVIGNLETPFVDNQKPYSAKSAHIKSYSRNVSTLNFLNVGVVNLANNHIYDFGKEGLELTKKILAKNNIKYFGVDKKQLIINEKDAKIALHGYCCYSTNPFGLDDGVNSLDLDLVSSLLKKNHKNGLLNIISIHAGQEHVHTPSYDHIRMARQFSTCCPYIFYGHHPHVVQSMETYNNSLIAYSLGNFCIDEVYTSKSKKPIFTPDQKHKNSIILELDISGNKLTSYKVIPIYIGPNSLTIGDPNITPELDSYSKELTKKPSIYCKERQEKINSYIASRKALRDFNWYLKRLNFSSVKHLLAARKNSKLYHKHVHSKLR